jgi:hypothetical protein
MGRTEGEDASRYTERIQDAISLAIRAHWLDDRQCRKGKDVPYIVHLLCVGLILARAAADETTIVAGILHDVVEDSAPEARITLDDLAQRFGPEAAAIVGEVTEPDKSLPWCERKEAALAGVSSLSRAALLVKTSDVLSNDWELLNDLSVAAAGGGSAEVFRRFNAPRSEFIQHKRRMHAALLAAWEESPLAPDLQALIAAFEDSAEDAVLSSGAQAPDVDSAHRRDATFEAY